MDGLLAELRHAARSWLHDPVVATAALVTLVLGLAATSAVFSVVDAVLFRPLPYRDSSTLVRVIGADPGDPDAGLAFEDFQALQTARSFEAIAAYYRNTGWSRVTLTSGEPESVQAAFTSASFFRVLGVAPMLGRSFEWDDERAQAAVAVLSHRLWIRRFAGASDVLGRTVEIDGRAFQIIGIMPPAFQFPAADVQLWAPITTNRFWADRLVPDAAHNASFFKRWHMGGRLHADVSVERARGDVSRNVAATLAPVDAGVSTRARRAMQLLFAAVLAVWLIACSNVVTLILARGTARTHELAVRRALGAGTGRLVRQTLCEVAVIIGAATTLALAVVSPIVGVLIAIGPRDVPRLEHAAVNGRVLAFMIAMTVSATGMIALIPSWSASRRNAAAALRSSGGPSATSRGRAPGILVAAQFALAVLLLVAAGLLGRSFAAIDALTLGFRPEQVLTVRVGLPSIAPPARRASLFDRLSDRIRGLPGVDAVGGIAGLFETAAPASLGFRAVEGRAPEPPDRWTALIWTTVSGEYFRAMGTAVLKGRVFTGRDGPNASLVAVIDASLAARYWPDEDPIGRRFKGQDPRGGHDDWLTVIGVVEDMRRQGRERLPAPHVFEWQPQSHRETADFVIRASRDAAGLALAVRAAIRAEEPAAIIASMATMQARLDDQLSGRRFQVWTLGIFALIALMLASAGIYGLMHHTIGRRRHELGIGMAVGARPVDVIKLVLVQGLALAASGIAAGVLASRWLGLFLKSLLFGVSPTDSITIGVSVVVLGLVAFAATAVPAWRASRVNPVVALRE